MSQPLAETKIRMTAAVRRKYVLTFVAVIVTPLACAAVNTVVADGSGVPIGWGVAVVVALAATWLVLLDRSSSTYVVRGGVLGSGGPRAKHVDLPRVVDASIRTKTIKVLAPGNPYASLELADCVGGRIKMVITTKRIPFVYEPEDLRLLADLLAHSTAPSAQETARQLAELTEQANRTLT